MRPAYITATRSQVSAITPMSCVTSITAAPCSLHRRLSSEMICAWIDTSSAVVGSSATISLRLGRQRQRDHHALAHAAGELVRVLVDALLGGRDAGFLQQLDRRAARASSSLTGRCVRMVSISCRPMVYSGFSEVSGSWKIAPMRRPRIARICS